MRSVCDARAGEAMTRSWWTKATTPQKLRQIDEAISIGLTCEETRVIYECQLTKSSFASFCAHHGRRFARDRVAADAKMRETNIIAMRRRRGLPELDRETAFERFG